MKPISIATFVCFALQLGCGGDGGGGGTTPTGGQSGSNGAPFMSGLDGSKKVNALTPQEQQTFCSVAEKFVKANPVVSTGPCKLLALLGVAFGSPQSDAQAQMLCKQTYDECVAMAGATSKCEQPPATCTATVAQAEACLSAAPAWLASSTAAIPACNTLKLSDVNSKSGGMSTELPKPAACKALADLGCSELDLTEL
jgi:hypothetical protein